MVSGYNKPGSSIWHVAQRCSGTFFSAMHAIDSVAAENRGLTPCNNCADGVWPHKSEDDETADRDPDEWIDKIEAGETALKFQSPQWSGPEYVGKETKDGDWLMYPLGMDHHVGSAGRGQIVSDIEDPDIEVETVDYSETPLEGYDGA